MHGIEEEREEERLGNKWKIVALITPPNSSAI